MEENVTQENQQTETPTESKSTPDLNLNDLAALRSILEVAVSRGAFKAPELEAVGKAFNKLNAFLEAVTKKD